jgi:hypothetical protein
VYIREDTADMHAINKTTVTPLVDVPYAELCPGSAALNALMQELR